MQTVFFIVLENVYIVCFPVGKHFLIITGLFLLMVFAQDL